MYKLCPGCQAQYPINHPQCTQCGHRFRTQFTPPDQTQAFGAMPAQQQGAQGQLQVVHVQSPPPKPSFMNESDWKWAVGFAWAGFIIFGSAGVYLIAEYFAVVYGASSVATGFAALAEFMLGRRLTYGTIALLLAVASIWVLRHLYVKKAMVPTSPTKAILIATGFCLLWAIIPVSRVMEVKKQQAKSNAFFGQNPFGTLDDFDPVVAIARYKDNDKNYFGATPQEVEKSFTESKMPKFDKAGPIAINAARKVVLGEYGSSINNKLGPPCYLANGQEAAVYGFKDGWVAVGFTQNGAAIVICTGPLDGAKAYPPVQQEYAAAHGGVIGTDYAGAHIVAAEIVD